MVKEFLSRRGVPFVEKDVSRDQAAAYEMIRKSGQRAVPQILVGDEIIVGFNRGRLEALLKPGDASAAPAGGSLGVRVADAATHAPGGGQGAYVGYVKPNSRAARGGVQPGDTILALNGESVANADTLIAKSKQLAAGQPVQALVIRDGRQHTLTLPG
jgi:glutaredoxin 3